MTGTLMRVKSGRRAFKRTEQPWERHEAGDVCVIPVFLRPCDWKDEAFGKLQGVPDDAKPITRWDDRDEAFTIVTRAVRKAAMALVERRQAHERAKQEAEAKREAEERRHREEDEKARLTLEKVRLALEERVHYAERLIYLVAPLMTPSQRVFLAHARKDKDRVRALYKQLKQRGFSPWLDEEDLIPGQTWKIEIEKVIREAGAFIACLSQNSVQKRGFVQTEFRLAFTAYGERPAGAIYFIPVRLDECEIPDLQIPNQGISIREFHWLDLWQEGGFERLIQALEKGLGIISRAMLKTGTVFRDIDAPWCPEMVALPAGEFTMGSPENEEGRFSGEGPQHSVVISRSFAIGRYPVTFDEYDHFCAVTKREKPGDEGWGRGRRPVINISWEDAQAYVSWLSQSTGEALSSAVGSRVGVCLPRWDDDALFLWQRDNTEGCELLGKQVQKDHRGGRLSTKRLGAL